jgi:hypothetical protein
LKPVTGWQIQPGILHAPGSLVTYQPQGNPDVFAVYQSMAAGAARCMGSPPHTARRRTPSVPGLSTSAWHRTTWLHDEKGGPLLRLKHMCWDGCMFPNAVTLDPKIWNAALGVMVEVRNAYGWN